ncbi:ParB/RepB/Spo0J family partition protein [Sphingomonas sp. PB1R3]
MTIQSVKLSNLSLSAINVRTASEETLEIESLAADIEARGVLVNLLVSPAGKSRGRFEVFDGGRRWRALNLLATQGKIALDTYDVPVRVLKADEATLSETSLAASFHQMKLTPAEECRAFQHFISKGADVDGVAKRLGVTVRFVEGRLRLAQLAEPIFDALAQGKITLDLAKAYGAASSQARQMLVWNSYGASAYYSVDTIRRQILSETIRSTEPIALLIGADAYVAAGGKIDADLFSDEGDKWINPEIAQGLASELLEAEAKRLGEDAGLAWVRPLVSTDIYTAARQLHRVSLPTAPLSEDEDARLTAIAERLQAIDDLSDNGQEFTEEECQAIEAEGDALEAEARDIRRRPQILPDELRSRVGAFLTLTKTGQMVLDTTYYSETPLTITAVEPAAGDGECSDDSDHDDTDAQSKDGAGDAPASAWRIEERPASTQPVPAAMAGPDGKQLSQVLYDQLAMQRRDVLGAALLSHPALAVDYMLFLMVDAREHGGSGSGATIRAPLPQNPMPVDAIPASRAAAHIAEAYDALDSKWTEHDDKVARFEAFRLLADDIKAAWLAWVVATSLEAKDSYSATVQNALQNRLATIMEVDVAQWWRPTSANFFDRVPKGALMSVLHEVGGPTLSSRYASGKKPEISSSCQKLFAGEAIVEAEVAQAALAWVPAAMRFPNTPAPSLEKATADVADGTASSELTVPLDPADDCELDTDIDLAALLVDEPDAIAAE